MRIEFICIIWTYFIGAKSYVGSWGLNLFVLFERANIYFNNCNSSWGLNLFVLFERLVLIVNQQQCSWGLNLFVLFELNAGVGTVNIGSWGLNLFVLFEPDIMYSAAMIVLEDWIYLYYLNSDIQVSFKPLFLRIEFICIIWTCITFLFNDTCSWGLNLFVLFEQMELFRIQKFGSWGLNLFVLFEPKQDYN